MKSKRKFLFFLLGGGMYTLMELLWRGRSHWSMFCLGGGCFLMLGRIPRLRLPKVLEPVVGSVGITAGELVTGLLCNRGYHVWDYRMVPLNFMGHICLPFSLLWVGLSFVGIRLYQWVDRHTGGPQIRP